ncbi:MAG: glucose-6-phosphate isomerase [Acidobacteria bacterium]|nr:glucose-6-phosphate isomerase [Acidobacteriota bacterium]
MQNVSNSPIAKFDSGLDIRFSPEPASLDFHFGPGIFGPSLEYRSLDAIRASLREPNSSGPDPVYSIAMDVGREEDKPELQKRMLLFGMVVYAQGRLGAEPVRSQGHVHAISPHCGWSTPELFEIWQGKAIVYGQEFSGDEPGRCVAIEAGPGEKVVIPPKWAHYVVNADIHSKLIFGAWCDRQYGFEYGQMRAHGGLAWFPLLDAAGNIGWERNPRYAPSRLQLRQAREYPDLGVPRETPIYESFRRDPETVQWVSDPGRVSQLWAGFEP